MIDCYLLTNAAGDQATRDAKLIERSYDVSQHDLFYGRPATRRVGGGRLG